MPTAQAELPKHRQWPEFLRVVIIERDKYPTLADAAEELQTSRATLSMRIQYARRQFPRVFADVPYYPKRAPVITEPQMLDWLRELLAESDAKQPAHEEVPD